jgi:hypothetical protein
MPHEPGRSRRRRQARDGLVQGDAPPRRVLAGEELTTLLAAIDNSGNRCAIHENT